MIPLVSWLPLTVAPPCFANASSSPDSVIGSEPVLLTTSVRAVAELQAVQLQQCDELRGSRTTTTTWAPDARSAATWGAMLTFVGT